MSRGKRGGGGAGWWRCGGVREGDRAAPIDPRKKARRSIFTRSLLLNDSCPGVYVYFYSEAHTVAKVRGLMNGGSGWEKILGRRVRLRIRN
ncbi:hypothetical protein CEXT_91521 [Caerostris extrusa]|uniref:Uncharacterized protein n=1 Tax=Caerostris extrusa TaxID=172846 RepID=A0AAV4XC04_CAEEX|nr:hypothetical protein CEXT_91521 [Caerostris extrusa]